MGTGNPESLDAGAPAPSVYVFAPDSDPAYAAIDRLVLARVAQTDIRERAAYEFFTVPDGGFRFWSGSREAPVMSRRVRPYRVGFVWVAATYRRACSEHVTHSRLLPKAFWMRSINVFSPSKPKPVPWV
jgi:hypothetical protein